MNGPHPVALAGGSFQALPVLDRDDAAAVADQPGSSSPAVTDPVLPAQLAEANPWSSPARARRS